MRARLVLVLASALLGCGSTTRPPATAWAELPLSESALGPLEMGLTRDRLDPALACTERSIDALDCDFALGPRRVTATLHFAEGSGASTLQLARVSWLRAPHRSIVYEEARRLLVGLAEHGWITASDRERLIGYLEQGAYAEPGSLAGGNVTMGVLIRDRIEVSFSLRRVDATAETAEEYALEIELALHTPSGPTWAGAPYFVAGRTATGSAPSVTVKR